MSLCYLIPTSQVLVTEKEINVLREKSANYNSKLLECEVINGNYISALEASNINHSAFLVSHLTW
jgi:hypothetical protein